VLDKCLSLCAKFPSVVPCEVCRRKAGLPPAAKRTVRTRSEVKTLNETIHFLRQRYENRTYKYMRIKPNLWQAQMRMPQALRDLTRAHT